MSISYLHETNNIPFIVFIVYANVSPAFDKEGKGDKLNCLISTSILRRTIGKVTINMITLIQNFYDTLGLNGGLSKLTIFHI